MRVRPAPGATSATVKQTDEVRILKAKIVANSGETVLSKYLPSSDRILPGTVIAVFNRPKVKCLLLRVIYGDANKVVKGIRKTLAYLPDFVIIISVSSW